MSVCDVDDTFRLWKSPKAPAVGRAIDLDETSDQLDRIAARIGRDPRLDAAAADLLMRIAGFRNDLRAALAPHFGAPR